MYIMHIHICRQFNYRPTVIPQEMPSHQPPRHSCRIQCLQLMLVSGPVSCQLVAELISVYNEWNMVAITISMVEQIQHNPT